MHSRAVTATEMGFRDQVRRPLLLVMLAVIPIIFISWGARMTAERPRWVTLPGGDRVLTDMRTLMTFIDVPIAIAFLAGLVGVFVVLAALDSDRRLVIAGYRPGEVIAPRLAVLLGAVLVVAVVSFIVMAFWVTPEQWAVFIGANLLLGIQYAAIGGLAGALLGRLGAVYFIFFLPNVDIGIAQDPLFFNGHPQGWATVLPGYGPTRMLLDAGLSPGFDTPGALAAGLAWAVVLVVALVLLLRHAVSAR